MRRRRFSSTRMKNAHPILLLIPVAVGFAAVICASLIHVLPLSATVSFVRREKNSAISASTSERIWEL